MALKKEAIDKLKTTLKGWDVDKLIAAATSAVDEDYEIPATTVVMTTDEKTTLENNMKAAGKKDGEAEGETKGKEIIVKKIAKKFAFDDAKIKEIGTDPDKLEAAVTEKHKGGDEALRNQVSALLSEKETWQKEKGDLTAKIDTVTFDTQLISMFPTDRTQELNDSERLGLIKGVFTFEKQADGTIVTKRNGKIVEDPTTHSPLPLDKTIQEYFSERKWSAAANEGGRGGQNNPPGGGGGTAGLKSLSKFTEKWKAENPGKNEISPEFDVALQTHMKANTDFKLDE